MREAYFPGQIIYCTERAEIEAYSRHLLKQAEANEYGELVLGFDTEWPFEHAMYMRSKTSLIQLCPGDDVCYLFYVYKLKELPTSLKMLLECDEVRFTGMDLVKDINKLSVSFGLNLTMSHRWIELDTLAKKKGITRPNLWGLKTLSKELLNLDVNKDERFSDWSEEKMTEKQKQYAATDAYVSLLLYQKLQKISSQRLNVQVNSYEREPRTQYQQASETENTESEGWGVPLLAAGAGAVAGLAALAWFMRPNRNN